MILIQVWLDWLRDERDTYARCAARSVADRCVNRITENLADNFELFEARFWLLRVALRERPFIHVIEP